MDRIVCAAVFMESLDRKYRKMIKNQKVSKISSGNEGVKNFVSLEVHASLDKSSICRNLLSVLGISCCRIFLLILV